MKKAILGLVVLSMSAVMLADVEKVSGKWSFHDKTFDEFKGSGSGSLTRVQARIARVSGSFSWDTLTINESFVVSGSWKGTGLTAQSASVSGSGSINGGVVSGDIIASGSLDAINLTVNGHTKASGGISFENSKLHAAEFCGKKVTLTNTSTGSILMKRNNGGFSSDIPFLAWIIGLFQNPELSTLYLKGSTIVEGDITFETGTGEVYVSPQAQIKGQVIGGKIIKN